MGVLLALLLLLLLLVVVAVRVLLLRALAPGRCSRARHCAPPPPRAACLARACGTPAGSCARTRARSAGRARRTGAAPARSGRAVWRAGGGSGWKRGGNQRAPCIKGCQTTCATSDKYQASTRMHLVQVHAGPHPPIFTSGLTGKEGIETQGMKAVCHLRLVPGIDEYQASTRTHLVQVHADHIQVQHAALHARGRAQAQRQVRHQRLRCDQGRRPCL